MPQNSAFPDQLHKTAVSGTFDFEMEARDRTTLFVSVVRQTAFSYDLTIDQEATPGLPDDSAAADTLFDETSRSSDLVDTFTLSGGKVRIHGDTGSASNEIEIRARAHTGQGPVAPLLEHVASLPAMSDGDTTRAKADADGRLIINKGTKDAGELIGPDAQRVRVDSAFHAWNGATLSSGQEITHKMTRKDPDGNDRTPDGARKLSGRLVASTGYGVYVRWYDDESFTTQIGTDEEIASGSAGAAETTFDVPARSPHAEIVVDEEGGGGDATVDGVVHLR